MRHEVVALSQGWAGTEQTVRKIESVVNDSLTDPVVVLTAQNLVRSLPERDKDAEIAAVSAFVRNKIRYTNEGIETIKTPRVLLDEIRRFGRAVGDCDDHVVLWLALHRALGNRVRVRVVSQRRDKLANHIYGEVYSPRRGWISDELIVKHRPLGWHIPQREVTYSQTYGMGVCCNLGGLDMDYFKPGGVGLADADTFTPQAEMFVQTPRRSVEYITKHGGMITTDDAGMGAEAIAEGELGIIPGVVAAALPLAQKLGPIAKMFGKKKKKKRRPAAPATCPPGYRYVPDAPGDAAPRGKKAGMLKKAKGLLSFFKKKKKKRSSMGDVYEAGMGG